MVMFLLRQPHVPIPRPRPINQADMFVTFRDPVNVQETRSDQRASSRFSCWGPLTNEFYLQSALLLCFAKRRLLRIFMQFNMPANRQPLVQLTMMHQQYFTVLNDKNCYREVDLLMDMRHRGRTLDASRSFVKRAPPFNRTPDQPGLPSPIQVLSGWDS